MFGSLVLKPSLHFLLLSARAYLPLLLIVPWKPRMTLFLAGPLALVSPLIDMLRSNRLESLAVKSRVACLSLLLWHMIWTKWAA